MITREADFEADALAIFDGAKDFVSRLDFPEYVAQDDEGLIEAIGFVTSMPGFECWLVENDGRIVGGIGFVIAPPLWNRRIMGISEVFIWTAPDAPPTAFLRLVKQFMKRKTETGAIYRELVNLTSSPPSIAKVYERMGLRKAQETWIGIG